MGTFLITAASVNHNHKNIYSKMAKVKTSVVKHSEAKCTKLFLPS